MGAGSGPSARGMRRDAPSGRELGELCAWAAPRREVPSMISLSALQTSAPDCCVAGRQPQQSRPLRPANSRHPRREWKDESTPNLGGREPDPAV